MVAGDGVHNASTGDGGVAEATASHLRDDARGLRASGRLRRVVAGADAGARLVPRKGRRAHRTASTSIAVGGPWLCQCARGFGGELNDS